MEYAARIKQAIAETPGLTQEQLAPKIGKTLATVNNYANGRSEPTASVLAKIAEATGKSISFFFPPARQRNAEESP